MSSVVSAPDLRKMQDLERKASELFSKSRVRLLNNRNQKDAGQTAFFASCSMQLIPVPTWQVDTAATDGKSMFFNPHFWAEELSDSTRLGVLIHEVLHCTNKHMSRRGDKDPVEWNIAADLAINPIVRDCGLSLTDDCLWPDKYGLPEFQSAEWYYNHMPPELKQLAQQIRDGEAEAAPGGVQDAGSGEGGGAGSQSDKTEADNRWSRIANSAAEFAKKRGSLPGSLQTTIDKYGKPKLDYWHILRQFLTARAKDDFTWSRPNRRSVHAGVYLPTPYSERLGRIVIAVDCSGSCWDLTILKRFASELSGVRDLHPTELVILYHDSRIQGEPVVIEPGEEFTVKPRGGGGTSHVPVFEWLEANGDDVECILCLTDLETQFPRTPPSVPTLWISTLDLPAPFGEVLVVE